MKNQWAESEETTNGPENKPKTLSLIFQGQVKKEDLTIFIDKVSEMLTGLKDSLSLKMGGIRLMLSIAESTINVQIQ